MVLTREVVESDTGVSVIGLSLKKKEKDHVQTSFA